MQLSTTLIFLALASSSLALRSPGFRDHRLSKGAILEAQRASNASLEQRSGKYNLIKSYEGKTFFKDMMFFTGNDPSHGSVDYVDHDTAHESGLIGMMDGMAMMRVAPHHSGIHRSVRPSTDISFTEGLIILDAMHHPTGCGTWPSFFTVPIDSNWPEDGEIDIIEGVGGMNRNKYSIHTTAGCRVVQDQMIMHAAKLTGGQNCDAEATSDEGCAISGTQNGDFGVEYNANHGGVHVLDWHHKTGIRIFFFPRGSIPQDIEDGHPEPNSWGSPRAAWPATHCPPDQFFKKHTGTFTSTLCGTWSGNDAVWHGTQPGQQKSCAAHTGHDSCESWLKSGKAEMNEAYWQIKSLSIYQITRRH
ncbi:unnamed protein product [Tilletia controversa]|uniref:GH16 domain-containing protein n=1 Tax=Tilletia controversa TaxID=13291 RepID=A0A8X7MR74_9BASI|nr:hypothetical protein CF328_g1135 [Tilletia controversa]KAE8244956.1 hypothetical protein A4X06_0g5886 [Tilletia controversa]CAD6916401.1 unnamed protein product [Tilletia controversa]CAD6977996.1 unnamed protein product [Tilletia controversa]